MSWLTKNLIAALAALLVSPWASFAADGASPSNERHGLPLLFQDGAGSAISGAQGERVFAAVGGDRAFDDSGADGEVLGVERCILHSLTVFLGAVRIARAFAVLSVLLIVTAPLTFARFERLHGGHPDQIMETS